MSRRTLSGIASIVCVAALASCSDRRPSSAELAKAFPARHAMLDTLRLMSDHDARVVRIAPDFTGLDSNAAWPRPDSLPWNLACTMGRVPAVVPTGRS